MEEKEITTGNIVQAILALLLFVGLVFFMVWFVWPIVGGLVSIQEPTSSTYHEVCFAVGGYINAVMETGSSTPESERGCKEARATADAYRVKEEAQEAQQEKVQREWCAAHTKQTMTLNEWRACQDI